MPSALGMRIWVMNFHTIRERDAAAQPALGSLME